MIRKTTNTQRKTFFSSEGHARPSVGMGRLFSQIFRALFKKRKILIISDKKITSIPFSPSIQILLTCTALVVTAWVSYTGGKNLHYKEALSEKEKTLHEKDRQITLSNLTNKDLLSQVTDLHRDLERLNTYFENIAEYDERHNQLKQSDAPRKQISDKNASLDLHQVPDHLSRGEIAKIRQTAHNTLQNINQGIIDRVKTLETAIAMTGLKLDAVTDISSYKPDNTPLQPNDPPGGPLGGPYIPEGKIKTGTDSPFKISSNNLDAHIDYLLHLEEVVNEMPLFYPIQNPRITSRFGVREDPFRKSSAIHYGLDLVGKKNARVTATAPGKVLRAGRYGAYGNFIEIKHANGITTRYGHLSTVLVHRGQKVARGDIIGIQGSTGRSTGAHLHYEIRHQDNPYNPEKFLKAGNYVFQENKG